MVNALCPQRGEAARALRGSLGCPCLVSQFLYGPYAPRTMSCTGSVSDSAELGRRRRYAGVCAQKGIGEEVADRRRGRFVHTRMQVGL